MPFTFSHPAAILPLTYVPKKWYSLTGLIIGSMSPDFEYFLRLRVQSHYSHTWAGLFWFDLPLTIFLAFIYHSIVRNSLIDNSPTIAKYRISTFRDFQWTAYFRSHIFVVIISSLVGATTHILWDGLTHYDGAFVQNIPYLQQHFSLADRQIPLYKIIQHLSTLFGAVLLLYSFYQLPLHLNDGKRYQPKYWVYVIMIMLVVVVGRLLIGDNNLIGNVIVTAISGLMIGAIMTPVLLNPIENGR